MENAKKNRLYTIAVCLTQTAHDQGFLEMSVSFNDKLCILAYATKCVKMFLKKASF